jgi:transposase InsO family protein
MGPMKIPTFDGKKYILVLVDDFSRYTWVELLKTRDEAPSAVSRFIRKIDMEMSHRGVKIHCIRSDNAKEFTSYDFLYELETQGIKHERTIPYTPQQNGVVERANQTIMGMARCMLCTITTEILGGGSEDSLLHQKSGFTQEIRERRETTYPI